MAKNLSAQTTTNINELTKLSNKQNENNHLLKLTKKKIK